MLSPQSSSRLCPSTPQLFDATVSPLQPDSRTAFTRFMGTPLKPKPPTSRKDPSLIPAIAESGSLYILENLNRRASLAASIVQIVIIK